MRFGKYGSVIQLTFLPGIDKDIFKHFIVNNVYFSINNHAYVEKIFNNKIIISSNYDHNFIAIEDTDKIINLIKNILKSYLDYIEINTIPCMKNSHYLDVTTLSSNYGIKFLANQEHYMRSNTSLKFIKHSSYENEISYCSNCGLVLNNDAYIKINNKIDICIFCIDEMISYDIKNHIHNMNQEYIKTLKSIKLSKKLI
jgi:hypothetical protein